MNYPLISEYIEAIKAAEDNFKELVNLRAVFGNDGQPVMTSGNFAVVFKMKNEQSGNFYALKCFTKEQEGRAEAYKQIAEELKDVDSPYLVSIRYLEKELFVDAEQTDETEFPVLLMDWAEGEPMDIGLHTYKVLTIGDYVDKPFDVAKLIWEMSRRSSAANGGLMRTSVVGLLPKEVEKHAADICRLTHFDPRCVGSCVIVSELIHSLVYKSQPLTFDQVIEIGNKYDERIQEYVYKAKDGTVDSLELPDEKSMGYTLKTLSAGLWAYWHSSTFEEGLLAIVNAGGDADTNAAVACAILGAKFGYNTIPNDYVEGLIHLEELNKVVGGIISLAETTLPHNNNN